MWVILHLFCLMNLTVACQPGAPGHPPRDPSKPKKSLLPKFFSNSPWGGWFPTNSSWEKWIEIWGMENSSVAFDSTEVGRDPESGWPRYWKGMGKGNAGVPPPPWSYIPENYGRPQFCYLQPEEGNCKRISYRWGFNPTLNKCAKFLYTGCGGNENNFLNQKDCDRACGRTPDTGCGW